MSEGTLWNLITNYMVEEWIQSYNVYVQEYVFPKVDIAPDMHILDCTELKVELENSNYEGSEVISTYELRPEIEEDYRQIKDFWQIEDFKSTKHNFIEFHVIMVLIGYLFFQLYKGMEEGMKYTGKTLPVVIKKYVDSSPKSVIIYSGHYFGIFGFLEFIQLYAPCGTEVKKCLDPILAKV